MEPVRIDMFIKITNFAPQPTESYVKAYFTVHTNFEMNEMFGTLSIEKMRLLFSSKGNYYVQTPTFFKENEGKKEFLPYISFGKENDYKLYKHILVNLEPFIKDMQNKTIIFEPDEKKEVISEEFPF